jgi:hypothetical protein
MVAVRDIKKDKDWAMMAVMAGSESAVIKNGWVFIAILAVT